MLQDKAYEIAENYTNDIKKAQQSFYYSTQKYENKALDLVHKSHCIEERKWNKKTYSIFMFINVSVFRMCTYIIIIFPCIQLFNEALY